MNMKKKPLENDYYPYRPDLVDKYPITRIGRWAKLSDYNLWLKAYLKAGGKPTHYYDYEWSGDEVCYVNKPYYAIPNLNGERMCGSSQRIFIVPKYYNVSTYARKLAVGHNELYGWENGMPVAVTSWVPVYADTVDKIIAQKEYERYIAEMIKKISPRNTYTVQELLELLSWIPEDCLVTGAQVMPPK